ncbi:16S rRNA (uracil(1498)-N(3))-methyltransferase [Candidatus Desantisbacteria bacterium]|nr:16S rRNA (uracil(1498)-N(3))-methyltransferase [Candidatus Desantisbacteria bacterium]
MNHNRFFVSPSQISQTHIKITDADNLHHIRVIRLRINDEIIVLDGKGNEYCARISSISKEQITASIVDHLVYPSPTLQITIVQSMPKLDKVNLIVEKCTEIGASRIVLVETSRSVKKQINLSRLERIAMSACSQSGRIFLPVIEEALFCDALAMVKQNDLGLMLWEDAKCGIGSILRGTENWFSNPPNDKQMADRNVRPPFPPASVVLFIGPEGGFSHEEADEATRMGIIPVSLGNQILRTETAGLVGLTIVAYEMGLLDNGGRVF